MKCLSCLTLFGALLCCLAASPARASMAGADTGGGEASGELLAGLQGVTLLMEEAATLPEVTAVLSRTKSSGPSTAPPTSKGMDRSESHAALPVAGNNYGGAGIFGRPGSSDSAGGATGTTGASGDQVPVAALPLHLQEEVNRYLGEPSLPSADFTAQVPASTTPLDLAPPAVGTPTVPIPAAIFLLGGGLIGLLPLRRSGLLSAGA